MASELIGIQNSSGDARQRGRGAGSEKGLRGWNDERKDMAEDCCRSGRHCMYAYAEECPGRPYRLETDDMPSLWPGMLGDSNVGSSKSTGGEGVMHGVRDKGGAAKWKSMS